MMIRSLSLELQNKAENELNEVSSRTEEDLEHIREWLKKQPHLNVRTDDQWLISFLRGCKFSLQRTKEKIDYFYTMRNLVTEFFANRDPFALDVQTLLQAGVLIPLPCTEGRPRIIMFCWERCDPDIMPLTSLMKVYFMIMDILMNEDDNCVISGLILLSDYRRLNLHYILQCTPSYLKKVMLCLQSAYPLRVKGIHCTNAPSAFETIFNLAKTFMNDKMKHRMSLYSESNSEKVFTHIPKNALPKELGGDNESIDVLAAYWKTKVESYEEWFLEDAKYCTIEELRGGSPKTVDNVFGVEGTFRKLTID